MASSSAGQSPDASSEEDDLLADAQKRLGTLLRGKYRLDRILGLGGMAVVYRAIHRNGAEFAVKMLHTQLSRRADVRARFLREGKAANSVRHPGVVMVVDDDVAEDGSAFIVMELLRGAAVEDLWERAHGRLPVEAAVSIALQLLDVLAAAHAKGVVHRDVKPANLFAARDGTLKVLDFGIARVRDLTAPTGKGTGTGVMLGTPAFMAPEQAYARSSDIDGQTDIWAVGATLFTLLTAECVHPGDNAAQLMIHAATMRARPLASVAPGVPACIADVVDKALAFEKSARWPDAAAMTAALAAAAVQVFGTTPGRAELAALVPQESVAPSASAGAAADQAGTLNWLGAAAQASATISTAGVSTPVRTRLTPAGWARALRRLGIAGGITAGVAVGTLLAWRVVGSGEAPATSGPATPFEGATAAGPVPLPASVGVAAPPAASVPVAPSSASASPAPSVTPAESPGRASKTVNAPPVRPRPRRPTPMRPATLEP